MFRLTLKNLRAHKLRLALTGLAVVLGVAFMAGTMVLTDTMSKTFDDVFATANSGIDVVIQQPEALDTEDGAGHRPRVDAATVDEVRSVDGVAGVAGSIQGFAQLVRADGTVASLDGMGGTVGMNWITEPDLNPFTLAAGHAPSGPHEVVLDKATLDREGWTVGDEITVLAKGDPSSMVVTGVATFGSADGLPGASLVAVDDATAQTLFAEPGHFDNIAVTAAEGVAPAVLAQRISGALGEGRFDVATGAEDTASKQDQFADDIGFFSTFLLVFAYIALFVGTFIIYNTFSILIAQRTKDLAMLRAIGASRRQVLGSVVAESAAVGIVAGGAGLGLGVAMSYGLRSLLGAVGVEIPSGATVVTTSTVVTSLVVGLVVTVLSAVAPALRGSRVRPIAALRDVAVDQSATSRARIATGLVLTIAGVVAFAAGVTGNGDGALVMLGVGAAAVLIGVLVSGPVIARPVVSVLGLPAGLVSGATGRLARENARRSPKRTAATASALMIGVTLVTFITVVASSTKASVADAIGRSFRADYVVESNAFGEGGFSTTMAPKLAALPEVETVSPLRGAEAAFGSEDIEVQAVDMSVIDRLYDMEVTEGSLRDVTGSGLAIGTATAKDQHLALGDPATIRFPNGTSANLTVKAIFGAILPGDDDTYLLDLSTFEQLAGDQYDRKVFVAARPGVGAAQSRAAIDEALAVYPNAEVQDQATFKESATKEIDQMLNLIYGLLGLAVVIALVGIANTLALSIHERRREIGLLRAVGMTRQQVRTSVRWEAALIALLGTAMGAALGLAASWGIVKAMADEQVTTLAVPVGQLLVIAAIAAVAGVVAAVGPARRAARMDVLGAITST